MSACQWVPSSSQNTSEDLLYWDRCTQQMFVDHRTAFPKHTSTDQNKSKSPLMLYLIPERPKHGFPCALESWLMAISLSMPPHPPPAPSAALPSSQNLQAHICSSVFHCPSKPAPVAQGQLLRFHFLGNPSMLIPENKLTHKIQLVKIPVVDTQVHLL